MSVKDADCVRFVRSFNVPLMLVGGGGYTICNVARCWCYETAVAVGVEPQDKLPYNEYYEYFGPDYTLYVAPSNMENLNTVKDLEKMENASHVVISILGMSRFKENQFLSWDGIGGNSVSLY